MKVKSKKGATIIREGEKFITIREEPTEVDDTLNRNPQFRMFLNMGIIEIMQVQSKGREQSGQTDRKGNPKQSNKK